MRVNGACDSCWPLETRGLNRASCRASTDRSFWATLPPRPLETVHFLGRGQLWKCGQAIWRTNASGYRLEIAAILVDDLSRLSRDLVETLSLFRRLQRHGVELVAVTDGIQTSHQMAKLQITIKGLVNELYLDDLRDKTHRGMTGQALKGLSTGGRLFGYRPTPGAEGTERVVFEPEAEIV